MRYRAIITADFTADLAELAHHEVLVNRAAAASREHYEDVAVHVVECRRAETCPGHAPLGEGARPVARGDRP